MSLLANLADRLILCPSTNPVDPGQNRRFTFDSGDAEVEAWVSQWGEFDSTVSAKRLVILKIGGTGGRAERASVHPAELLVAAEKDNYFDAAEVWTLNHRGYGGSTGPASLRNFVSTLESFWDLIAKRYPAEKKLATGNSLGCISALYLAKRKKIAALLLRNPPPVKQLIASRPRYNWWSLGFAKLVARQVPDQLDSISNGSMTACPALFVTSERDRVVPPFYQQKILDSYAGESRQFIIEGAAHHHPIPSHQERDYFAAMDWLRQRLID